MIENKELVHENDFNTVQYEPFVIKEHRIYFIIKRIFDIVLSSVACIVLCIPMLLLAIMIWIESPGPVIYKQERLGVNGEKFNMYKFRSMKLNAEENGPTWASVNDNRCTKVGKVMRLFHMDELPQLWNIIKGEMTIVGPRPEREYFYNIFEKSIPQFRERLRVKPGLTGLSQVNGCYDLTPEERLMYDKEYIENMSFLLDLKCIIKTVFVVFNHKGAR